MSAYGEFVQEKREIDALLEQGYIVVGVWEGLDGADVRFERHGSVPDRKELRLLTADARKYVSGVVIGQQIGSES